MNSSIFALCKINRSTSQVRVNCKCESTDFFFKFTFSFLNPISVDTKQFFTVDAIAKLRLKQCRPKATGFLADPCHLIICREVFTMVLSEE